MTKAGTWVVVPKDPRKPAFGFWAEDPLDAYRMAAESGLLGYGAVLEPASLRSILERLREGANYLYQKPDPRDYQYFAEDRLRDIRSNLERVKVADRDLFEEIAIAAICGILHCERGEVR
jgi:hypothetical protein